MSAEKQNAECEIYRDMTVANLREKAELDHVIVVFLESARLYKLNRSNPGFEKTISRLRDALETQRAIKIGFESLDTDIICEVRNQ